MARPARAAVEGPAVHELHRGVSVQVPPHDALEHDILARRPDGGHPTGQGVEDGVVPAGGRVAGDPEQAVVRVGQGGVQIRQPGVEVVEPKWNRR